MKKQVAAGHQAYVVYPVIEEGGKEAELKAAIKMHEQLRSREFSSLRVGLLHGRMSAEEKDRTMADFKRGEVHVLVSTTVIEVGVDVPNANVMVIEHAERFGLSQMHQLRGRIGRGAAKSYCILMTGGKVSIEAQQRLDAMTRTQNGSRLPNSTCSSAAPASSSAPGRRACQTFAWRICCVTAICWRPRARKLATFSPAQTPTSTNPRSTARSPTCEVTGTAATDWWKWDSSWEWQAYDISNRTLTGAVLYGIEGSLLAFPTVSS